MKNLIIVVIILNGIYSYAQKHNELENYDWDKLNSVTLFNLNKVEEESDSLTLNHLTKFTKKTECQNIKTWRRAFYGLRFGPEKDILIEKETYVLLLEFQNHRKIPIIFFPKQKAIYDLRKNYRYFDSFPKKSNLITKLFSNCLYDLREKF